MVCYAHFTAAGTEALSSFSGLVRIRVRLMTQLNKCLVPPSTFPRPQRSDWVVPILSNSGTDGEEKEKR